MHFASVVSFRYSAPISSGSLNTLRSKRTNAREANRLIQFFMKLLIINGKLIYSALNSSSCHSAIGLSVVSAPQRADGRKKITETKFAKDRKDLEASQLEAMAVFLIHELHLLAHQPLTSMYRANLAWPFLILVHSL